MRLFQKIFFLLQAQTSHGLHSPSVFNLYSEVINPILQKRISKKIKTDELIQGISQYYAQEIDSGEVFPLVIPRLSPEIYQQIDQDLLPKAQFNSILFILNPYETTLSQDIWDTLVDDPRVIHSIDLFDMGILRFNPLASKQHFMLKKSYT
ncbi:hypothetical protein EWU23_00850 [Cytophagaceae bacterium 50C-KIRBA]|uniref:Uncharacterized protein n=1 Tax=Aquirufa beregesia TaxID=2516556 RepID=A0ABX0ESQ0_9BACT|nr:hypothetical protein [Aquirufa beregesia]NGZ43018.1 hypothetical protein [Aquirufa beregesia]